MSLTPRGEAFVEAARALAPDIEAAADRIESERQLPRHIVDGLYSAGLFTMLLPRSLGGAELDLPTFVRAIELLARADGSVAWCVGQANGLCNYMAYAEPATARALYANGERTILANGPGEGNRPGAAVECEGGYRVSGRWMFASGIGHATWLLAVCQLYAPDQTPRMDAEERPAQRLMLLPKRAATLHDVWHVSGLRGTGSQSFSVLDVFVPASHVVRFAPEARQEDGPLYLFTNNGLFGPAFGSVALGLAHASLAAIVDFAAGKVPRGMERSIRESATLSVPAAATWTLLPVHTPLVGAVIATFGGVVSPPLLVVFDTVTVRVDVPVWPFESLTVAFSAREPFGELALFQLNVLLAPL